MLGACSFAKCSAVRWNVCLLYGVRHTVRTSGLPVHLGYIRGRGTDLMYPLGRVPTGYEADDIDEAVMDVTLYKHYFYPSFLK